MRHRVFVEIFGVCVNRAFGQFDFERAFGKANGRFVKADVPVAAYPQKLNVNVRLVELVVIAAAFRFDVGCVAVQEMHVLLLNIRVVKQLFMHKGVIAVFVVARQTDVFVQVVGPHVFKAHFALLAGRRYVLISRDGRRARCKA